MSPGATTALAKVLTEIDDLSWDHALYIPETAPSWSADMSVMILDPECTEDPDADPIAATDNGLRYALPITSVQDVLCNLRAQGGKADLAQQLEALRYYFENDAFIELK